MKKTTAVLIILVLTVSAVWGTGTKFYEFKGVQGFASPVKSEGIGIHSKGYLTLIPKIEKIQSPEEQIIWTVLKVGGILYAGVGETGKILYFLEDGDSGELANLGKFAVKALAADGEGVLFAGGPDGVLHGFTSDEEDTVFYETGEKYIWSILISGPDIYVGTGPDGKIFKIARDGTGKLLYDSTEKHILSMVMLNGKLYAGTVGSGLIIEVDPETGDSKVLTEIPGEEVLDIITLDGKLYVISRKGKPDPKKKSAPKKGSSSKPVPSAIYKVDPESGEVEIFFISSKGNMLTIAPLPDGRIAAGCDIAGKIYFVKEKLDVIIANIPDVGKVLDIVPVEDGFLATTEKKGFICKAVFNGESKGEYISRVCEMPGIEKWGLLKTELLGGKREDLTCSVRTGKVREPDDSWSEWKVLQDGDVSDVSTDLKYFQIRIEMKAAAEQAPVQLKSISISYLPENRKPEITTFTVGNQGKGSSQQSGKEKGSGAARPQAGAAKPKPGISFAWKASDLNGDMLVFRLFQRVEGTEKWIPVTKDPITGIKFMLNTRFYPDGKYEFKIEASDEKANLAGKELKAEKEVSESVIVDQSGPAVSDLTFISTEKGTVISCAVTDTYSKIAQGFYNVNNGEWIPISPSDGLYDETAEEFAFTVESDEIEKGDAVLVRFIDEKVNYSVKQGVVPE